MITKLSFQSVKKTGKAMVVHEAPLTQGFGAELAARLQVGAMRYHVFIWVSYCRHSVL